MIHLFLWNRRHFIQKTFVTYVTKIIYKSKFFQTKPASLSHFQLSTQWLNREFERRRYFPITVSIVIMDNKADDEQIMAASFGYHLDVDG